MRGEPNTAIRHLSKCGSEQMQENITFYDEKGNMCLQIHFGHHGYPKKHNMGTDDKPDYWHKHRYTIVKDENTGKTKLQKGEMEPLSDEERRLKS